MIGGYPRDWMETSVFSHRTLAVEEWRTAPANCLTHSQALTDGCSREKIEESFVLSIYFTEELENLNSSKTFFDWLPENSPSNQIHTAKQMDGWLWWLL
jgi:hypothetical protein